MKDILLMRGVTAHYNNFSY